jgi:ABC-2 type transport system permease protein
MQSAGKSWKNVILRELKRMSSRRLYVMMTVILPLLGYGFFIALFSSGKPTDLPIAVLDNDASLLSRQIIQNVNLGATVEITDHVSDLLEAKNGIIQGDYYGVLVIPKDFYTKVIRNEQPEVIFYYNNAYMVVGSLLRAEINQTISTISSGVNLQVRLKKGESMQSALVSVNPIAVDGHKLFNPFMNYFYYLATTFLPIMLLIFILMSTVYAIGSEYKDGTAATWLETANGSILRAVSGKLLPYAIIWFVMMLFMNVIIFYFFKTPVGGSGWLLVVNAMLFVFAYMATGIFIAAIFPAMRMGLSVASIYSALAFTFSGLTFPYMAMYGVVAFVGNFFPFSHYLRIFLDQSLRAAPVFASFEPLLYLNLFLLLPFTVLLKLKRMCTDESYWGKL